MFSKYSFLSLILLLLFSCNKTDSSIVIYPTSPTEAFRLTRWESKPLLSYNDYYYDNQGRIDSVASWEGDYRSKSLYQYNQFGLIEQKEYYTGFSELSLSSRSIYHYGQDGRLDSIHTKHFSRDNTFTFSSAKIYSYQSDNEVKEIFRRFPSTGTYLSIAMEWEDGNIVASTHFDSDGSVRVEQSFSYDDRPNWQRTLFPYGAEHPYIASRNNQIFTETAIFYNTNNYPDSIYFDFQGVSPNLQWMFSYETN